MSGQDKLLQDRTVTELLQNLVRFPSLSTREQELADWLETQLSASGLFRVEKYGDNLVFHLGSGRPWLLLNTHSDVVPPSEHHAGDPFRPVLENGRIHGRGTTDAKGCGSAMIRAMVELAEASWRPARGKGTVSMALTVCEEGSGEHNGMAQLRSRLPAPDAALVGEPTSLAPCIAQKGLLIVRLATEGASGHAARSPGPNAIKRMGEVIQQLEQVGFSESNEWLGTTRITPTVIQGGTVRNAMPGQCSLDLDIRTIPDVPVDRILQTLDEQVDARVECLSRRLVATATDPQSSIARCAHRGSEEPFFGSPTSSDWVYLADVPTIKIGPGHSEQSHTADESIEVDQLEQGVRLYKDIITCYFQNE